jgi:hypothetical protein
MPYSCIYGRAKPKEHLESALRVLISKKSLRWIKMAPPAVSTSPIVRQARSYSVGSLRSRMGPHASGTAGCNRCRSRCTPAPDTPRGRGLLRPHRIAPQRLWPHLQQWPMIRPLRAPPTSAAQHGTAHAHMSIGLKQREPATLKDTGRAHSWLPVTVAWGQVSSELN